ncbi:MAG: hypothetical protein AAB397_03240 [Patescibacteria group bacterium]
MGINFLNKKFRIVCPQHPDKICSLIKFSSQENDKILIELELGDEKNQCFFFVIEKNEFEKLEKLLEETSRVLLAYNGNNLLFKTVNKDIYFGYYFSSGETMMGWQLLEELL